MNEQPRRWGRPDPMADPPSPSRLWNLPNGLTMLRLLLVPVFGYLLLVGQSDASRWLARTHGIFSGLSTGANLRAALDLAATLPPDRPVVTIQCDRGDRYLSVLGS